jgi:hypothetical protein
LGNLRINERELSMRHLFAYLDPGTGSMVLQVVVGGIAAIGVAGRYYWKRLTGRGQTDQEETGAESATSVGDRQAGHVE